MTEKPKCSKCKANEATSSGITITIKETQEKEVFYDGYLCESCAEEIFKCSECKAKKPETRIIRNKVKFYVCQDCKEKLEKGGLEEIIRKAHEFKEKMKDLYEQVNENSPAEKIQEVIAKIDQFLCVNFRTNIDDFAEGKTKNMDNKDISQEERNAIGEAFPYLGYPKKVLEWRKNQQNKQPRERERERERERAKKIRWFSQMRGMR